MIDRFRLVYKNPNIIYRLNGLNLTVSLLLDRYDDTNEPFSFVNGHERHFGELAAFHITRYMLHFVNTVDTHFSGPHLSRLFTYLNVYM